MHSLNTRIVFDTQIPGFNILAERTAFNACRIYLDLSASGLTDTDIERFFAAPNYDEFAFSGDTIAPRVFAFGYRDFPDCMTASGLTNFVELIAENYCDMHDDLFFDFYGNVQAQSVNCDCLQCIERRAQ